MSAELDSLKLTQASLKASIAKREAHPNPSDDHRFVTGKEKERLAEVEGRIKVLSTPSTETPTASK